MSRGITKRPRAKRDLVDHFAYLAEHASIDDARRFLRAIDDALELLLGMPEMGAVPRHKSYSRRSLTFPAPPSILMRP